MEESPVRYGLSSPIVVGGARILSRAFGGVIRVLLGRSDETRVLRDRVMSRKSTSLCSVVATAITACACSQSATAETPRAVVELFTSQGCSSCPPADAVVGRLLTHPEVLVLSFQRGPRMRREL